MPFNDQQNLICIELNPIKNWEQKILRKISLPVFNNYSDENDEESNGNSDNNHYKEVYLMKKDLTFFGFNSLPLIFLHQFLVNVHHLKELNYQHHWKFLVNGD